MISGAAAFAEPWSDGESLSYDIAWGIVPVAHADFTARRAGEGWGFHLELRSTGPIEAVKPIRDKVDSRVGVVPWRSIRYEENRKEGSHLRHRIWTVDYPARQGAYHDQIDKSSKSFSFTPDQLDDIESLFYHLRRFSWPPGSAPKRLPVYYGTNLVPVEVTFQGRESVEAPEGGAPIPCIVLRLRPLYADAKKNAEGHWATVWLSDDARHIPWRAAFKASFGTFTMARTGA